MHRFVRRGHGDSDVVMVLEVPGNSVRAGVEALRSEFEARVGDQFDRRRWGRVR